jgi:hypothetical protein
LENVSSFISTRRECSFNIIRQAIIRNIHNITVHHI